MARYEHLPIYKSALDLCVHFEKLVADRGQVSHFPSRCCRSNAVIASLLREAMCFDQLPKSKFVSAASSSGKWET